MNLIIFNELYTVSTYDIKLSLYTSYLIGKYSNALFVLEFLTKSMTGDEIAINVLSTVL